MKIAVAVMAVAGLAASAQAFPISIVPTAVPFVDISVSGTLIPAPAAGDDTEHTITGATLIALGWTGAAVTNPLLAGGVSVRVGNNGGVIWGNAVADAFAGATDIGWYNTGPLNSTAPAGSQTSIATMLPSNVGQSANGGGVRQVLFPLWDDYTPGAGGSTRFQVIGGDLYIQWTNEDLFAASGTGVATFQMVVRGAPAAGANLVDFVYQDTLFAAAQYQNDGGSATIGYKNNGNAFGNDVEFGIGGGTAAATSDATGVGRQAKIAGWASNGGFAGPNSVSIVPAPGSLALLGLGGLLVGRRRR